MHRRLIYTLAIALILSLVSADAVAGKKSRSGRKQARASSKKDRRTKSSSSRVAKRGKGRREVARRGRRGRGRERIASRSRRHEARSQPVVSQDSSQVSDAPPAPRPVASGIPPQRVTEIQEALIKQGYLAGPASGLYDENTSQAMKRFQAANKLPTTGMPSAHTLKRLSVAKRSNDGYAVPVKSVSDGEKKHQSPEDDD